MTIHQLLFVLSISLAANAQFNQYISQVLNKPVTAGVSVGEIAVFSVGGMQSPNVEIFNASSMEWSNITAAVPVCYECGAAALGSKVFFAGGYLSNQMTNVVNIFDLETGYWSSATLGVSRIRPAGASAGNKLVFAGGDVWGSSSGGMGIVPTDAVDIYDGATNTWCTTKLSQPRRNPHAVSVGNKILFVGGLYDSQAVDVVDIYDTESGIWAVAKLSQQRETASSATIGTKAYICGGYHNTYGMLLYTSDTIDVYDSLTNTWSLLHLSQPKLLANSAASIGNYFIVGGGYEGDYGNNTNFVEILDVTTGKSSYATLGSARGDIVAVTVGDIVMFVGGYGNNYGPSAVVDIFYTTSKPTITRTTPSIPSAKTTSPSLSTGLYPSTICPTTGNSPTTMGISSGTSSTSTPTTIKLIPVFDETNVATHKTISIVVMCIVSLLLI